MASVIWSEQATPDRAGANAGCPLSKHGGFGLYSNCRAD
jgi:hypothetical protein